MRTQPCLRRRAGRSEACLLPNVLLVDEPILGTSSFTCLARAPSAVSQRLERLPAIPPSQS